MEVNLSREGLIAALESKDPAFIRKITRLVRAIKAIDTGDDPPLGITLSLGEHSREVYEEWFEAGAHRYLLRIESSNPDLYRKIHPDDPQHSFDTRLECLWNLKEIGYGQWGDFSPKK